MTVDRELVTRKLLLITQDLDAVAPLATKPVSAFLESRFDQAVVERLLERMIGRMIDVNYQSDYREWPAAAARLSCVFPETIRFGNRGPRVRAAHRAVRRPSRTVS